MIITPFPLGTEGMLFAAVLGLTVIYCVTSELVVNVRSRDGNVVREVISDNVKNGTIDLTFTTFDLTKVTQFIDYSQGVQIFRVVILGEEDLGQPPFRELCFVNHFASGDFISVEAVSKLRQKNPQTIRVAEESQSARLHQIDATLDPSKSYLISTYIQKLCSSPQAMIFTSEDELRAIASARTVSLDELLLATHRLPKTTSTSACSATSFLSQQCLCQYEVNIGWYPCSLKFCDGYDDAGMAVKYRCGIRACSSRRVYEFPMSHKLDCFWQW